MTTVLVAGAGPTGLALACGLRLHDVDVRVIDKAPAPATTSRANILYGRGVEVLYRFGALGELPERSVQPMRLVTHVNGRPGLTMRLPQSADVRSRALYVSQAEIEGALRDRFTKLGGTVEWNAGVTDATQNDTGVTVESSDGRTIRADWLVGCDGAHSTVRKAAGIGFPGVPVIEQFLLADVHVDMSLDRNAGNIFLHRDGVLLAIPMRLLGRTEDVWRLMANVDPEGDAELNEAAILDRFLRLLPERAGVTDARIHRAAWTSVFRIQRRLADSYRHGRILLAGDAAHIHSPVGGQGINTGIGDAENLAWKLALVATGHGNATLLDTYQAERRPLAENVLRTTTANTKLIVGEGWFNRFLRDRVLFPIGRIEAVQRRNAAVASQLSVSYRRGPLGDGGRFGRKPKPGDRIPDRECVRDNGEKTSLHNELGGHWALLAPKTADDTAVRDRLGDYVRTLERTDNTNETWLIRPDGHLAWRGQPTDTGTLRRWLEDVLA